MNRTAPQREACRSCAHSHDERKGTLGALPPLGGYVYPRAALAKDRIAPRFFTRPKLGKRDFEQFRRLPGPDEGRTC